MSETKVASKTIVSEARFTALKAELQQTMGESSKVKAKTPRYSGATLIVEHAGLSLSIPLKWDKVDSDELNAKVRRVHKINTGTPESPQWINVHEKPMYEDNKRVWIDETGKQYDGSMVHDFTILEDGKEIETRPFPMTKELRVIKEIPRTEIESEFLIESQYEMFAPNMAGSLWKYAQILNNSQSAAVAKIVLRSGYKDYNALIVPIIRPDGQFVMLAYLVRQRKKLKHWMPTNAQDASAQEKLDNANAQTISVTEEI